ncbi:MAG TPA: glycosyltransferase family 39 protein [Candidatus Acidoferrales bacterium]|nr:glycosyltransferase family 39 protein [Candidatus Acidoferrales bacterium]
MDSLRLEPSVLERMVATGAPSVSIAALVTAFAAAAFGLHLLTASRYGYFRDELYYAACGQHLAWGYVDHAPLIAAIYWFTRRLFGDSLVSLRLLPALSAAGKVVLTSWMVRELGGRRFAQCLAAVIVFFCPIFLTMDSFLSMNSFEPLFWMGCVAVAMYIVKGGSPRLWLLFGLIAGVGILNKHSTLFFGLAFFVSLLITSGTRYLKNIWIWLGAAIAFVIFLPNLLWEIRYHFPTIEVLQNAARLKNAPVSWYGFLAEQALLVHPLAFPVVLAGLWFFFRSKAGRSYRFLGWTYVFVLLLMLVLKGRIYYVAPIYPMLFAAGAVWVESKVERSQWQWLQQAILIPLTVGGIVAAPLALPILPVDAAARYSNFWDIHKVRVENYDSGRLPQFYADMFGWQNQAKVVASVYKNLPAEDRGRCTILAANYGEAGAIDYFGGKYGLPRAISPHNNYYLWGPRNGPADVVIAVGMDLHKLRLLFGDVQQASMIIEPYAIPEESNLPVYVCRNPRVPLSQAWPWLKFFG